MVEIKIKLLDEGLQLPQYQHSGDAGLDLSSRVALTLDPGERALIPTGVSLSIPNGYAGFVLPRSGLAVRHGIALVNSPGLIDSGYRGEIALIIINTDKSQPFRLERGDRVAQLVIQKVEEVVLVRVSELDATERGVGGFESTGRSRSRIS